MPVLTDEQQRQVARRRKSTRPAYWSASAGAFSEISQDFEAYIILLQQGLRAKLGTVLKNSTDLATRQKDRDELLAEVIQAEINDSKKTVDELDNTLSAYSSFEQEVGFSAWADVPEVSLMAQDIRRGVREINMARRQAVHDYIVASIAKRSLEQGIVTENVKQQMRSWSIPLGSYG